MVWCALAGTKKVERQAKVYAVLSGQRLGEQKLIAFLFFLSFVVYFCMMVAISVGRGVFRPDSMMLVELLMKIQREWTVSSLCTTITERSSNFL